MRGIKLCEIDVYLHDIQWVLDAVDWVYLLCAAGILSVEQLPACGHVLEDVCSYPWHIDNKYYTADVLLCTTHNRTIGDKAFAEAVQAFIVVFDSKQVCCCTMFLSYDSSSV